MTAAATIALVGRPNVGKSTLFNLLTKSKRAIVDDRPGVTRDRIYGTMVVDRDSDLVANLVDTGGFETDDFNFQPFGDNLVWQQTQLAIDEADMVIFMVDGKAGLHPHDDVLHRYLVKKEKPFICICNKVDGLEQAHLAYDFYEIGLEAIPVSAAHKKGLDPLQERLVEFLETRQKVQKAAVDDGSRKIALIGRPNVGKSSILNRLVGEDRALVSEIAGTTRDSIDVVIKSKGQTYTIIDTAGIRRKSKIEDKVESLSVMRSLRVIEDADVVLLVIDAVEGLADQDARLIVHAIERFKPVAIVVNKWDLIPDKTTQTAAEYRKDLLDRLGHYSFVPIHFVSCLHNKRVHNLLSVVADLYERASRRVSTGRLNEFMQQVINDHTPALMSGSKKRVRIFYTTQVRSSPPTFVVFCNVANQIQESYKRYLLNRLRKDLGFEDVPVRILFRDKEAVRTRSDIRMLNAEAEKREGRPDVRPGLISRG